MLINKIEIVHLSMPLVNFFETSFERVYSRKLLIIKIHSDGKIGYGECVAGENPGFSYETIETCSYILREFIIPSVFKRRPTTPQELMTGLSRIRGHNMAKASLETAFFDLFAKIQDIPLYQLLGGVQTEFPTGVSVGIQDTLDQLLKKIEDYIKEGYKRIKFKIKPGWDYDVIKEVRKTFPEVPLMVDANSAYSLDDIEMLKSLDEFGLMMIEQPLGYMDLVDHAQLQKQISTPLCLDESINSVDNLKAALALGSCKIINIKYARVGGLSEAKKIHDICLQKNIPVWAGGMLETGIGRAHNIALATLPNFTIPGDISASKKYFERDLIVPPVRLTEAGTIKAFSNPGIGVNVDEDFLSSLTDKVEVFL